MADAVNSGMGLNGKEEKNTSERRRFQILTKERNTKNVGRLVSKELEQRMR